MQGRCGNAHMCDHARSDSPDYVVSSWSAATLGGAVAAADMQQDDPPPANRAGDQRAHCQGLGHAHAMPSPEHTPEQPASLPVSGRPSLSPSQRPSCKRQASEPLSPQQAQRARLLPGAQREGEQAPPEAGRQQEDAGSKQQVCPEPDMQRRRLTMSVLSSLAWPALRHTAHPMSSPPPPTPPRPCLPAILADHCSPLSFRWTGAHWSAPTGRPQCWRRCIPLRRAVRSS